MDNISDKLPSYINKIYNKAGYLDKYGGSVVVTCVTFFIFFIIFSYFYVQSHISKIRKNWTTEKCNPSVLPFAGMIMAPDNMSPFKFTAENFEKCATTILAEIIHMFTLPIHFISEGLAEFFKLIGEAIQKVRELFAKIRQSIMNIIENIMHRILNVVIQLQKVMIDLKDILGKTQASLATGLYTVMGSYLAMKAFMGAMIQIIIEALIVAAAIIIVLWIFPWTWPIAAPATVLFALVATLLGIIIGGLEEIIQISAGNIPPVPGCFHEDTIIEMSHGIKKIKDIKLNDVLRDGSKVTAIFKILKGENKLYELDNFVVTGNHDVLHETRGWIKVCNHEKAKLKENDDDIVYCLNTTTKKIKINNTIFADWDEVHEEDVELAKEIFSDIKNTSDFHKYIDSGFEKNTIIKLRDGSINFIQEIKLGDELEDHSVVMGIVEIDAKHIDKLVEHKIHRKYFIGTPNLVFKDKHLGVCPLIFKKNSVNQPINKNKSNKLYHLITSSGKFMIE